MTTIKEEGRILATLTETPRRGEQPETMPTFHATLTFKGPDTIVAEKIVVTGRFQNPGELQDWIETGTRRLMEDIEQEQGGRSGG